MDSLLPKGLELLAKRVIEENAANRTKIATAESCTGGLVSAALTEISGSSAVFLCGYVTYANQAKIAMLNVDPATIDAHGAVSEQVAGQMAQGAAAASGADSAVAISGVAGPGGGTAYNPVGTVTFGLFKNGETTTIRKQFGEDSSRAEIRKRATLYALEMLLP